MQDLDERAPADDTREPATAQSMHHAASESDLPSSPSAPTTQQRVEAKVRHLLFQSKPLATRIGRYLVLEKIGHGGMGLVYAAYDEQLDRKVAVKLLLDDGFLGEPDHRRFQREAQALARLSHPNVVTVHEVGESGGSSFLAMEYVRGQSLADWLRTEPDWPRVLAAFVQAGRGLVAAHRAGVIHRDLKPTNIMRGDDGAVKVLDFGLARVATDELDESLSRISSTDSYTALSSTLTQPGMVMGTPLYMSPEQFEGEAVDERSDLYSFCVAAWEGLAGQRPFEAPTIADLRAAKLRGPPPWPNSRSSVPRGIVEALRRGLAPDPRDRWPSMETLLEVLSKDPRRRRNRWLLGLAGVGALGLAGAGLQSWLHARNQRCSGAAEELAGIWDEARRAEVADAMLGVDKPYAASVWERVRGELDDYADAWSQVHRDACEATTVRGEQSPQMLDLRMACLQRAGLDLRAAVEVFASADVAVLQNAHELIAGLRPLSRCSDAEALAADVEPPMSHEAPTVDEIRLHLARARNLLMAGRYRASREAIDEARRLVEQVEYEPIHTMVLLDGSATHDYLGEYEAAEAMLTKALRLALRNDQKYEAATAASRLMFLVGHQRKLYGEAMRYWPLAEELSRGHPLEQARSRINYALVLGEHGRYAEGEAEMRAALSVREKHLGPEHPYVAQTRNDLAVLLRLQGKLEAAEAEHRAVLALRERVLSPDHPHIAISRGNLAFVLGERGLHEQAAAESRAAYTLLRESYGDQHPAVANVRGNLGVELRELGRYAEAETELRACVSVMEGVFGPDQPAAEECQVELVLVMLDWGRFADALPMAERVWARMQRDDVLPPQRAQAGFALARALWDVAEPDRDRERARGLADDALRSYRSAGDAERERAQQIERWLNERD